MVQMISRLSNCSRTLLSFHLLATPPAEQRDGDSYLSFDLAFFLITKLSETLAKSIILLSYEQRPVRTRTITPNFKICAKSSLFCRYVIVAGLLLYDCMLEIHNARRVREHFLLNFSRFRTWSSRGTKEGIAAGEDRAFSAFAIKRFKLLVITLAC